MKHIVNNYREFSVTLDGMSIVFFIDSGFSLNSTSKHITAPHSHYHYEILFVLEGGMYLGVGELAQKIEKGECALVPRNLIHCPSFCEGTLRIAIAFNIASVKNADSVIYRRLRSLVDNSDLSVIKNPLLEETVRRMMRYYYGNFEFSKELVTGCLRDIVLLMCQSEATSSQIGAVDLEDSKNYRNYLIQEYFSRPKHDKSFSYSSLSLDELSEILHLSKKQTQRSVSKLMGRSFCAHLIYLKVARAAELLKNTEMTVEEIYFSVGYVSSRSFYYAFKKEFGKTPLEYRSEEKMKISNK